MTYWDVTQLDLNDSLNAEIWAESPNVQRSIQEPGEVRNVGSYGAQQAMLDDGYTVLPWVPDIVGKEWMRPNGLMIVGSAYAGFIKEYSGRGHTLALSSYDASLTIGEFQSLFLSEVVKGDHSYYGPIEELASSVGSIAHLALFDLCRASFVQRGSRQGEDRDKSNDKVARSAAALFERYVEHEKAQDWTWRRLSSGEARCIVALGTIAEYGLLRLFARRGMSIAASDHASLISQEPEGKWVGGYAGQGRTLVSWLNQDAWWTIKGTVGGASRTWRLLPVYHPRRRDRDPRYGCTIALLGKMCGQQ